jgi:2-oxoglutarate/2-oxoacid ferredoxin oxidoreductase subunit beta
MAATSEKIKVEVSASDFKGPKPSWCPGCGDFGLLSAMNKALANLGYKPNEVVIVSGIGCSGNFPHFTSAYGFHSTHGRSLPAAMGMALVNPDLKIIVVGGDGDGYGIGAGHFIHAARRNINLTYVVMNNQIYGLTLGQSSPTSQMKHITLTSPEGVDERPINPIPLALGAGASFVARTFSGEGKHLEEVLREAIEHNGFALVDDLSPCVTFNRLNTYDWFRERIYKLEETEHDNSNIVKAFEKGLEWGDKIPIGVIFKDEGQSLQQLDQTLRSGVIPVHTELGIKHINPDEIYDEFR